jgi:hypothetical protein
MQTEPVICPIVIQGLSAVGSPCPATNVPWVEMLPVIPANESRGGICEPPPCGAPRGWAQVSARAFQRIRRFWYRPSRLGEGTR